MDQCLQCTTAYEAKVFMQELIDCASNLPFPSGLLHYFEMLKYCVVADPYRCLARITVDVSNCLKWCIILILRYHYNVADARLCQHIEKGNEDGLFISSVASCQNLWALIMDAGTGFSSQVYELSPYFLHKVNFFFPDGSNISDQHQLVFIFYSLWPLLVQNQCPRNWNVTKKKKKKKKKLIIDYLVGVFEGMDNGAMGEELLHHSSSWSH